MDPLPGVPHYLACFGDLARSNREPTDQERRDISAVLAAVSSAHSRQLADWRKREEEANRTLAIATFGQINGQAQPDEVQVALELYNSCGLARSIAEDHPPSSSPAYRLLQTILHPIRYVPQDILILIFKAAVDDAAETACTIYDRGIALRLAAVSARWRQVALRTRTIWRLITLVLRLNAATGPYREYLSTVTQRAGDDVLFDVRIEQYGYFYHNVADVIPTILEFLPAHRNLKVVLRLDDHVRGLCQLYYCGDHDCDKRSQVEDLQFIGARSSCPQQCPSVTPRLRKSTVSLCHFRQAFKRSVPLPGTPFCIAGGELFHVQHVTLRPHPEDRRLEGTTRPLLRIFYAFPDATTFDLDLRNVRAILPADEDLRMEHSKVQQLRIEFESQLHILASLYSLPALSDVTFHCTHMMTIPPGLIHMLRHAFAAVRTLRITYKHETLIDSDFAAALGEMSNLESLDMTKCRPDAGFFHRLAHAHPRKCPALGTLKFRDTLIPNDGVSNALLDFIQDRRDAADGVARIQHLEAVALVDPGSFAARLASALA